MKAARAQSISAATWIGLATLAIGLPAATVSLKQCEHVVQKKALKTAVRCLRTDLVDGWCVSDEIECPADNSISSARAICNIRNTESVSLAPLAKNKIVMVALGQQTRGKCQVVHGSQTLVALASGDPSGETVERDVPPLPENGSFRIQCSAAECFAALELVCLPSKPHLTK